jgi:hypothetical protein
MLNSDFRVGPWLVRPSLNTISLNGTCNHLEPKVYPCVSPCPLDAALAWLPNMEPDWEPAVSMQANVFPNLVTPRIEPMWDPLRSDPGFEELVRRMHLPQ